MASLVPLDDASGGFLRVHSRAASTAYHVVVKKKARATRDSWLLVVYCTM